MHRIQNVPNLVDDSFHPLIGLVRKDKWTSFIGFSFNRAKSAHTGNLADKKFLLHVLSKRQSWQNCGNSAQISFLFHSLPKKAGVDCVGRLISALPTARDSRRLVWAQSMFLLGDSWSSIVCKTLSSSHKNHTEGKIILDPFSRPAVSWSCLALSVGGRRPFPSVSFFAAE